MPHIRFRKIETHHVKTLSETLLKPLATEIKCADDWLTFEHIQSTGFCHGKSHAGNPFVEVLWFEREKEVKDNVAKLITNEIKKLIDSKEITVIFVPLQEVNYYENGEHF
ncbi:MAG: DUF1904 family protein [Fusobacteria bacterium]|nr:DUF1904 family protein [Fusobacteriota bacterium]